MFGLITGYLKVFTKNKEIAQGTVLCVDSGTGQGTVLRPGGQRHRTVPRPVPRPVIIAKCWLICLKLNFQILRSLVLKF
jgi:hypothetical protein